MMDYAWLFWGVIALLVGAFGAIWPEKFRDWSEAKYQSWGGTVGKQASLVRWRLLGAVWILGAFVMFWQAIC